MSTLKEQYLQQAILALSYEGKRIINECVNERTYDHRTYNLYDSYGFGVYYNGALRRMGYLNASKTADKARKWYGQKVWGREEIESFLKSEYSPAKKGFDLVIAAAMPYGRVLENASSGQHKKYKVISMAYDKLATLSSGLKGSSVRPLNSGRI